MNLYKLHNKPTELNHHDHMQENVPELVWEKYKSDLKKLKEYEGMFAGDAEYAYKYAHDVLKGRFIAGEEVLATDATWGFMYARYMDLRRVRK